VLGGRHFLRCERLGTFLNLEADSLLDGGDRPDRERPGATGDESDQPTRRVIWTPGVLVGLIGIEHCLHRIHLGWSRANEHDIGTASKQGRKVSRRQAVRVSLIPFLPIHGRKLLKAVSTSRTRWASRSANRSGRKGRS
jgi:hypothetical protein